MFSTSGSNSSWLQHRNHSSSSLVASGLEVVIPPEDPSHQLPICFDYASKQLPPIPNYHPQDKSVPDCTETWNPQNQSATTASCDFSRIVRENKPNPPSLAINPIVSLPSPSSNTGIHTLSTPTATGSSSKPLRLTASTRSLSSSPQKNIRNLRTHTATGSSHKISQLTGLDFTTSPTQSTNMPNTPPISKSSLKILQLTGFDPRFEKTFPEKHQQNEAPPSPVSSLSSESSASLYSKPASGYTDETVSELWGSPLPTPLSMRGYGSQSPLQSSTYYNAGSEDRGSPPAASFRRPDCPPKSRETVGEPIKGHNRKFSIQDLTLEELTTLQSQLVKETYERRHDDDLVERHELSAYSNAEEFLAPRSLTIRRGDKPKYIMIEPPRRPSILQSERKSTDWNTAGLRELVSPPVGEQRGPMPLRFVLPGDRLSSPELQSPSQKSRSRSKQKKVARGDHSLKSPFPISAFQDVESSDILASLRESRFTRNISTRIKRFSGENTTVTTSGVIPNKARKPDGPDTPTFIRSNLLPLLPTDIIHKGNEHLHGVFAKAKKSITIKSSDERKRESLRKKIVVIGLTDQSPGI